MTNWKTYKLSEIGTLARGKSKHRPRDASHLYGGDYPFIQTGDVKNANHKIYTYTQTYSEAGLAQSKLWEAGTLCITIAANIADTAILTFPACFPDSVLGFVPDPEKCDIEFMEYMLQYYKKQIQQHSIGSVQENINLGTFQNITFQLPHLLTQRRIAEILSALDDKIELNRRMNQTLEQMAQTLFRQFFVDGIDEENLPEGWREVKVQDVINITIGRTPPRAQREWFTTDPADVKWMSIKDLGNCGVYISDTSEYLTEAAVKKFNVPVIPENTVVLSFKLTVGRVAITTDTMLSNEAIAHFIPKADTYLSSEFVYQYLKEFNYDSLGNTSSIATAVNSKTIKEMPILLPDHQKVAKYTDSVKDLFAKIKSNSKEITTFTQLRDTLLPKLMSGEIDVMQTKPDELHEPVLS